MEKTLTLSTDRLVLEPLAEGDYTFVRELVNSPGWLQFIGNRNVNSTEDAKAYINKISSNPAIVYWVVSRKQDQAKVGVISFIKRDYLDHHDIGFAFLPAYANKGYAYEAAQATLSALINRYRFSHILATTIPANTKSIKLLQKLGFAFDKEIMPEKDKLHVYKAPRERLLQPGIN